VATFDPGPPDSADHGNDVQALRVEIEELRAQLADSQLAERRLLQSLRELGTPVLPIHDGILVMPLIGHLDSTRGVHLIDDLLEAIQQHRADVVLIDITGVSLVDTTVANSLIQATRAAGLLGTSCMLVGVSAAVARTLVQLGIELSQVDTRRDLQAGISLALKQRGYAIVRERPETDWLSEFDDEAKRESQEASTAADEPAKDAKDAKATEKKRGAAKPEKDGSDGGA
jgi:anti-anti-sigma regulatory factor